MRSIDGIQRRQVRDVVSSSSTAATAEPRRVFKGARILLGLTLLLSLAVWLLPLYPHVQYSLRSLSLPHPIIARFLRNQTKPAEVLAAENLEGNWLLIPSIGVKAHILEGSEIGVLDAQEGVWHQTGDLVKNNFVIAGHRFKYLPPNTQTFYNLDKLQIGDSIQVVWGGKKYNYKVQTSWTVPKEQTSILESSGTPELTLYTCVDTTYKDRLVIRAVPN